MTEIQPSDLPSDNIVDRQNNGRIVGKLVWNPRLRIRRIRVACQQRGLDSPPRRKQVSVRIDRLGLFDGDRCLLGGGDLLTQVFGENCNRIDPGFSKLS
jgi:hypothetical protein